MNREQRRRLGAPKEAVYTLNASQIETMKQDATNKAIDQAFILFLGISAMVIHDYYPKLMKKEVDGKSREERFIDMALDQYSSFVEGYLEIQDFKDCILEECGIDIQDKREKRRV